LKLPGDQDSKDVRGNKDLNMAKEGETEELRDLLYLDFKGRGWS